MAILGQTTIEQADKEIILSRLYDAPQELVFSMFKNSEHISQWWGPTTWPVKISNLDFKVGGTWHYCMEGPNGDQAWGKAVYQEIDEPYKIVFKDMFSDAEGSENPELPQGIITVTFEEVEGKTKLTLRGTYKTVEEREAVVKMGMLEGMKDTWDQLEKLLQKEQQ